MTILANQHILIENTRIAYGVYGEGDPLILIHGTPSSSYIWRHVLPVCVEAGYQVYVYDLLGFGLSERPWDVRIDTSVTGQVPILRGLIQAWGLPSAHIVAHDIGGAAAKRFALENPEQVRTLTLIDIVSYDSWPSPRTIQQLQDGLDNLINKPDAEHRAHYAEWLLSAVANKEKLADSALPIYLEYISGPVGQGSLYQHQVSHYDPIHTMNVSEDLPKLGQLPVQILWGADDQWQVKSWATRLHEAILGAELYVIEDCGHFAMEDQPEIVAKRVLDFISRHNSS